MKTQIEKLIEIGGREWTHPGTGETRVYFNDLAERCGLSCSYYGTGNISGASINGERLSNNKAGKISHTLRWGKFWYSDADELYHGQGLGEWFEIVLADVKAAVAAIE